MADQRGSVNPAYRHGHNRRGERSPEYETWASMIARCNKPSRADFPRYGGRGIRVCDRWSDFTLFLSDVGARPSDRHSIDRIDTNGNYEPGNCRWATIEEQNRNRRSTRLTPFLVSEIRKRVSAGEQQKQVARSIGVSLPTVNHVISGRTWKGVGL